MAYETIDVRPMAGALGAEVFGVDLTDLGDQTFTEIHRALLNHQLLYLDDQPLDNVDAAHQDKVHGYGTQHHDKQLGQPDVR